VGAIVVFSTTSPRRWTAQNLLDDPLQGRHLRGEISDRLGTDETSVGCAPSKRSQAHQVRVGKRFL